MHEKYDHIIKNIKSAREEGNKRKIKIWETKLKNWQAEYGSCSPIRPQQKTESENKVENLMDKALQNAGYDCEVTEENLIQCFYDYADSGIWGDLDLETAKEEFKDGEITIEDMCKTLIRLR